MTHRLGWPFFCDPIMCEWVTCPPPCGKRFQRPVGAKYAECLACQTANRLRDADIKPDDPELATAAAWNGDAQRNSGIPTTEGRAA